MSDPGTRELAAQIAALHEDVLEVKQLAKETNGRVRKLEAWRVGIDTLVKLRSVAEGARRTLYVALGAAGAGGFVTYIAGLLIHH